MNILVFSWRDPKHPLSGGAEQVMHEHMKGWVGAGHKVTLFSSQPGKLSKRELLDGIEIVRDGYQYGGVQLAGFFYYLRNKDNFGLVIDQFHGLPFFTPFYVRKPRLAIIQETARNIWFLNPLPMPFNWLVGIFGYFLEPIIFTLYRTTPFMTGSWSAKKDVAKFGIPPRNIRVISHGVITVVPRPFPKKEKIHTIVYLGILAKDKGIEDALKCFALLATHDRFQFWVLGKPETQEYMNKLKSLCDQLGLAKAVRFWGFVTQRKKFELLARAHVLINPSSREGWGLVNIETNSMGTPVVAYDSPGLVDSVKNGMSGVLCSRTPHALAAAVLGIIDKKAKYSRLQKGAVNWSKRFSWNRAQKRSLKLINMLY